MNKTIKVTLKESDVALLDRQAVEQGVTRAQLMRSKLFAKGEKFSPVDYYQLVASACRTSDLPRNQVEQLVNFVFVRLLAPSPQEATLD